MDKIAVGDPINLYISTGLTAWDDNGGLTRGILTVIGAATGDGKSFMKLHLASVAAAAGLQVLMVDFEDPGEKTADRTFSAETGINNRRLGTMDSITEFEYEQMERAYAKISDWAARIDHHEGLTDVATCLTLMKARHYDLILIDYAQAFPEGDEGKTETIAKFAWDANVIAQQESSAVVVFSQVNAKVEARGYERYERWKFRQEGAPDVSGFCPTGRADISWATALGERAKCLLYLWRPGRIARKLGHKKIKDDRMLLIAAKANFAIEEDITLAFNGETATISDWRE
jgi:replicative DNA helicase